MEAGCRQLIGRALVGAYLAMGLCACSSPESAVRDPVIPLEPDLVLNGPELYKPVAVDIAGDGRLYVLDAGNYRVYEYSGQGTLLRTFGRAGQGPHELPFLGTDSTLEVGHGVVTVFMRGAQRVLMFQLPDLLPDAFGFVGYATDVGFDGALVHAILASEPDGRLPDAAVYRFSMEGSLVDSYGTPLRPDWNEAGVSRDLQMRNDNSLAVDGRGRVFEGFRWWPLVRAYQDGELQWERWLDMKPRLVDDAPHAAEIFDRGPSVLASLDGGALEADPMLDVLILLDISASSEEVFLHISGHWVQVLDAATGAPGRTYFLRPPPAGQPQTPGSIRRLRGYSLGVSPDGRRLCVPDDFNADVLCYSVGR